MTAELQSEEISSEARPARRLPGEEGVWVIIAGDLLVFALFFLTFMFYRGQEIDAFTAAQHALHPAHGLVNTMLLLTSSWFVASGVRAARGGDRVLAPRLFSGAVLCGIGFVIVKFFEYGDKIGAGITLTTNNFFMFYFMFTGIHLVHVLIGLGVLGYICARSRRATAAGADFAVIESGGVFWHLVDLLWIVLFALFYLVK